MLRRIMWFVVGLLALTVVAAAIVPRGTSEQPRLPAIPAPERTTLKVDIGASPTRARQIAAHVGDHLLLTVESDGIDTVTIPALDEIQPVSSTTPAQFDTLLDQPGRFEIRMQDANKVVGVLDVKPTA